MKLPGTKAPLPPARKQPISIVSVDDHRFMRELISAMLARQEGRYSAGAEKGEAATSIEAFEEFAPDLVILDIDLPDPRDLGAVTHIGERTSKIRILLCAGCVPDDCVVQALRSGADRVVEKTSTWEDFIEAFERVGRGAHLCTAHSTPTYEIPALPFSPREAEILNLIAGEGTDTEIASKLYQQRSGRCASSEVTR